MSNPDNLRVRVVGKACLPLMLLTFVFALTLNTEAQPLPPPPDYTNALWNQAYPGHWYTSGAGHYFCIIHDMEGYYESTLSYFQQSNTDASVYYCVNSLQNGSDKMGHRENNPNDAPAGQITQMVREQYWAWHVSCWNPWMFGTEHEGFVDSPAWYSETMYEASAALQQHLCNGPNANTPPIPMDRNHIIGHDEWENPAWTNWMATNWPQIDTTCNNHTDPGPYWNWPHFMSLVCKPNILSQPLDQTVTQGQQVTFSLTVTNVGTNNPTTYQWMVDGSIIPDATNASLTLTDVQLGDAGLYSIVLSNAYSSVTSSNANLTVNGSITDLAVQPRPSSAIVTWNTDAPSDGEVDYGLTTNYEVGYTYDGDLVTNHIALLTGLIPGQTYYFDVISYDEDGNEAIATNFFVTATNIIVESIHASYSGVWVGDSSAPDRYSPTYYFASVAPAAPQASATFRPLILTPAQYDVYFWYSEGANRSKIAPMTASYNGGFVSTYVNETLKSGKWMLLASNVNMLAGTNGFVRLGNYTGESNKIVISDAVQWVYTPGQDQPVNGSVPAWWANYYFGTNAVDGSTIAANGYTVLNDYILGIAPDDPDTTLDFSLYQFNNGFQAMFYPWEGGRTYQLQSTTNPAHPVWQALTNLPVTTDDSGDGLITSTNAPLVPTFYRLSVQLTQ
ncbi:MAG TPA: N-acetylmuramoyl-L-alanine amidase [Verrucomicrobiae bacterium]|nr:N-acetylmuramoyl-L-alanine amidase [Verrucomicrobiae bacterium]